MKSMLFLTMWQEPICNNNNKKQIQEMLNIYGTQAAIEMPCGTEHTGLGLLVPFLPKLHLTTAYQPLISATFSLCDFY